MKQSEFKRFNMIKPPLRQQSYLLPLIWALSFPAIIKHKVKIKKVNMGGLKPPYLLLCNHNSFMDFKVASAAIFPHRANYVVAIDGFIKREWLLRLVGCICKRKFTSDVQLLFQLRRVIKNGDIAVIYPEARYSLCGTASDLPDALYGLAAYLKVPIVTLIAHGHHINSPFWNTTDRKVKPLEAVMTQVITAEEAVSLPVREIAKRIKSQFTYDDFAWQRENRIKVSDSNRAKGLHKVLYRCPNCNKEYKTGSNGAELFCRSCGKSWIMDEYGVLRATDGKTEFSHIPDWYEWQRAMVKDEVESGSYSFSSKVRVRSLPNSKGFIDLGEGFLTHGKNGFMLTGCFDGEKYSVEFGVKSLYACHIEYNYLGKYGDCIDLNTLTDTYYIYPLADENGEDNFSVTKIALATEELYKKFRRELADDQSSDFDKSMVSRFRKNINS